MDFISSWILSICGMVLLSLLIDIIMPQKVLTKFVKAITGVFMLLVIVKPFANIDLANVNFNNLNFSNIQVDNSFITDREEEKQQALKMSIESCLDRNGYKNINITFSINKENLLIKGVFVDLKNLVLTSQNMNIDKYTNIVAIIKQFVSISEENIVFYE